MVEQWVSDELKTADLKDKRLNDRLETVVSSLCKRPNRSIPQATGGHAEMTAAYRFFSNYKVTADGILTPHGDATKQRVAAQSVALCVQDTTEVDLTRPKQQVAGAGILDGGGRYGVYLHELHAFTPNNVPLGTVWSERKLREKKPDPELENRTEQFKGKASSQSPSVNNTILEQAPTTDSSDDAADATTKKSKAYKNIPIEEKESYRWVQGLRATRELAKQCPDTTCICVGDSESDIFEVFTEPTEVENCHLIVRACQERALVGGTHDDARTCFEAVSRAPVVDRMLIQLREREPKVSCDDRKRRKKRMARSAKVEVRATRVTLRPPGRPAGHKLSQVSLNVILVREKHPPEGEEAVEWVLLTTLPIDTLEQILLVIKYYCVRWQIEVFFRTLKTGCRVEGRLFEHIDRLLPCLAVYLIAAWRTMYICHMAREFPDAPCTLIFSESEWKALWMAQRNDSLPNTPPRLETFVRMVAQLGGYVNRANRKDPPGAQTIWQGLERLNDLAWAWERYGPGKIQKDV